MHMPSRWGSSVVALALAATVALASCSGDDSDDTYTAPEPTPVLEPSWTAKVWPFQPSAVGPDTWIVDTDHTSGAGRASTTQPGRTYGYDLATGKRIWKRPAAIDCGFSNAYPDGDGVVGIVTSSGRKDAYCDVVAGISAATGRTVWTADAPPLAGPVMTSEAAVVAESFETGEPAVCLDRATGDALDPGSATCTSTAAMNDTPDPIPTDERGVVPDPFLVVGSDDGVTLGTRPQGGLLVARDAETGEELWRRGLDATTEVFADAHGFVRAVPRGSSLDLQRLSDAHDPDSWTDVAVVRGVVFVAPAGDLTFFSRGGSVLAFEVPAT